MLSSTAYKLGAGMAVLALSMAAGWYVNGTRWESKYNERESAYQTAVAIQQAQHRATEQDWQTRITLIEKQAAKDLEHHAAAVSAATGDAERLRIALAERNRRASQDSSAAGNCEAIRGAASLYADLLSESQSLAGQYALEADRRGLIARACADSYDALGR